MLVTLWGAKEGGEGGRIGREPPSPALTSFVFSFSIPFCLQISLSLSLYLSFGNFLRYQEHAHDPARGGGGGRGGAE